MDSPQSVVSSLKNSVSSESPKQQNASFFPQNPSFQSKEMNFQVKQTTPVNSENSLVASLEVYIHQARDVHNICIYQNQDVYAKLSFTSDPENTVSTKIINKGGRNPIFNENLSLNVKKIDSSLKCEIWMLSRVKNYLEDQLLGVALVPVSEILLNNGKLEKDFSLSSNDLFHSPAGFVQLSISYIGAQPDVIPIPSPNPCADHDISDDLDKIEFPDPNVVNENCQMVEEYCSNLDSQGSENLISSDTENQVNSKVTDQNGDSKSLWVCEKADSPLSTTEISSASCEIPKESKSVMEEHVSPPPKEEKTANGSDAENNAFPKPLVSVNIEPEPKMVQQDIVDMYMKSMQQFTESLAKMKLPDPVGFENGPTSSGNSSSDPKSPGTKNSGPRVYYGSRAFF